MRKTTVYYIGNQRSYLIACNAKREPGEVWLHITSHKQLRRVVLVDNDRLLWGDTRCFPSHEVEELSHRSRRLTLTKIAGGKIWGHAARVLVKDECANETSKQ